ncbi:MAG: hypothetical protein PHC34_10820 [Candidatus Gastranaerophilales bacterium]|nr:hypothetical protein [Candidatus Gastranaerophilales bacterium]
MINNKKINIFLALTLAASVLSFNSYTAYSQSTSAKKPAEFYLPKSAFSKANNISTKKPSSVQKNTTTIKPEIKVNTKALPEIKPKIPPVLKPKTMPEIKPQITNITPLIKSKTTPENKSKIMTEIKPQVKTITTPATRTNITSSVIEPDISLSDFIKNFNDSYSNTFTSTLYALSESKVEILSFNSKEGKIYARLYNKKNLYVLVHPVNDNNTSVRITPTDGVYNISDIVIKEIFKDIKADLTASKSAS